MSHHHLPKFSLTHLTHCTIFVNILFIWAPRRLWDIPLICSECKIKLTHGGLYTTARKVTDLNWKYYMVGEYLRYSKCRQPQCLWRTELLDQLSPAQRLRFPAILTKKLALDKKRRNFDETSYHGEDI